MSGIYEKLYTDGKPVITVGESLTLVFANMIKSGVVPPYEFMRCGVLDDLIRNTHGNPKWWHLYKHAKKYRTRKKYCGLLVEQLHHKLAAER